MGVPLWAVFASGERPRRESPKVTCCPHRTSPFWGNRTSQVRSTSKLRLLDIGDCGPPQPRRSKALASPRSLTLPAPFTVPVALVAVPSTGGRARAGPRDGVPFLARWPLIGPTRGQQEGSVMPHYEFYCEKCEQEVTLTMSIADRERGGYKCPGCGSKALKPLMGTFFSQTSRKA